MWRRIVVYISLSLLIACQAEKPSTEPMTVKQVMDSMVTRLYAEVPSDQYDEIDTDFMLNFLNEEEKQVLATQYQYFDVNVPVVVSLMRHIDQETVPFWLPASGFEKTDMTVKNVEYTYEVWQKSFDAGQVELGFNGFDKHRPVYFISVAPQNEGDELSISNYYPDYELTTLDTGAFTYHDWTELVITEIPPSLRGQQLFTTVRGRAREAHVVDGFRESPFPSSTTPDQIVLTWSGDPTSTMDIQWRTNTEIEEGSVKYWKETGDTLTASAEKFVMEDRMLYNDRYTHRFTAHLTGLESGQEYQYIVGDENHWSEPTSFTTEPKDADHFSYVWFGDTHRSPVWGEMLQKAHAQFPGAAFYSIAGDLVSTGLYRNEWDMFFEYAGKPFSEKPLMPVPGNHDKQDGLGAWMYYAQFSLPENGPADVEPESTYSFSYGNAFFLMIDCTSPIEAQTAWIEEQLAGTDATWKFVMFHFPPYNYEEPYPDIQAAWGTLFDKYHVDVVMGGHTHYYMRTKPMKGGKVVNTPEEGTIYMISIGIPSKHDNMLDEPYAEVRYDAGPFYQHMDIKGNQFTFQSFNKEGKMTDEITIQK